MTANTRKGSALTALLAISLSCGSYAFAGERNDTNNYKEGQDPSLFATILHEKVATAPKPTHIPTAEELAVAKSTMPASPNRKKPIEKTSSNKKIHDSDKADKLDKADKAAIDPEDLKVLQELEQATSYKSQTPKLDEDGAIYKPSVAALQGKVSAIDPGTTVPSQIDKVTELALKSNKDAERVQKLVDKYSTKTQKAIVFGKEMAYAIVPYRGFSPSKEGSQILLERVKKIKTLAAAEYFKQRIEDDTHTKVVGRMLEIAMGLDEPNKERSEKMINNGYQHLKKLIGEEDAQKTVDTMVAWSKSLNIPNSAFEQQPIDVDAFQNGVKDITLTAVKGDPVMRETIKKVRRYSPNKAMVALSSVIESGSALTCLFGPGMLLPVGVELINGAFVAGTGGCEETKLVNQMYIGKRMESRWRRLNEETTLAITNYQTALRTKSPTLLACSESIIEQLVGPDKVSNVLGQTVLASKDRHSEVPLQTAERPMQDIK